MKRLLTIVLAATAGCGGNLGGPTRDGGPSDTGISDGAAPDGTASRDGGTDDGALTDGGTANDAWGVPPDGGP